MSDVMERMEPLAEMAALVPRHVVAPASGYWFLASPYTKYPAGLCAAFKLAVETRGLLIAAGIPVFSPVIHSHPVAMACGLDPVNLTLWLATEAPMRLAARGMIELRAANWEMSVGMTAERREFILHGKPIVPMLPGILPKEFLA